MAQPSLTSIPYSGKASTPDQTLDLYLPNGKSPFGAKPPLLVYAHGGAWISGDKDEYRELGQAFASQGVPTAVIDYRLSLSPDLKHPIHAKDLAEALHWLSQNPSHYDGQRIILMGHSAGAHMAGILALHPSWARTFPIATIGLEGIYDLPDLIRVWPGYLNWFISKAFGKSDGWPAASPTLQPIREKTPWLVIHSDQDELVDKPQSTRFVAHLKEANVDVTYFEATHGTHFGVLEGLGKNENALTKVILDFIKKKSQGA